MGNPSIYIKDFSEPNEAYTIRLLGILYLVQTNSANMVQNRCALNTPTVVIRTDLLLHEQENHSPLPSKNSRNGGNMRVYVFIYFTIVRLTVN